MNALLYDAAKYAFLAGFRTLWRMRVYGAANVPATGPVILACNHVSYLDPPVLGAACPRRISYMAKEELFRIPLLGPMIRAVGAYPVDRTGSATAAIKRSISALRAGGAIGIFPEGTRNLRGDAQTHVGVALLASLSGAPVVPVALSGTARAKQFAQIRVFFGSPLALPSGRKASRDELANFTDELMRAIRSLPESLDQRT